ncbi:MAG: phosphate butyryltransferase [Peptococcaceae bacterium]
MNFDAILAKVAKNNSKNTVAIAAADDEHVLKAVKGCLDLGLGKFILVGNEEKIINLGQKLAMDFGNLEIINEPQIDKTGYQAVRAVVEGRARIVMKGLIGTAAFLKAVLNKEQGLRTGSILSHVAVFEIPGRDNLLTVTDCAMNIAPALEEKIKIIKNVTQVTGALAMEKPKIAAVCAVETVNPQMPATIDAALLAKMSERGQLGNVLVDGPLALDNAVSREAALHKGIISPVAGQAEVILVPNIETGNVLYKALAFMGNAKSAGIVVGAGAPIVLTSRADSFETKIRSLALSLLVSAGH